MWSFIIFLITNSELEKRTICQKGPQLVIGHTLGCFCIFFLMVKVWHGIKKAKVENK